MESPNNSGILLFIFVQENLFKVKVRIVRLGKLKKVRSDVSPHVMENLSLRDIIFLVMCFSDMNFLIRQQYV